MEAGVVLTAAHCCEFEKADNLRIVAGDRNLKEEEGPEQTVNVKEIIMHESFRQENRREPGSPPKIEKSIDLT